MIVVHFYKDIKLVYSVYANSLEEVKKEPLKYYSEYTKNMFIVDKEFEYPIISDNQIREMNKEEKIEKNIEVQLYDGEYIKNKKLIFVEKPGEFYYWDNKQNKWLLNEEELKNNYFEIIEQYKKEKLESGFEYKYKDKIYIQKCREKDISTISTNIISLQTLEKIGINREITWYFSDESYIVFGLKELQDLMMFGVSFVQSVYDTEHFFKTQKPKEVLTKEEFENKRKEIYNKLIGENN